MKKLLPALAILILIAAIGMVLMRSTGRDAGALRAEDSTGNSTAATPEKPNEKPGNDHRTRTRRLTLEQGLPPGSKLADSKKMPGGIEVTLANGSRIDASGASVTESGISFRGPYEFADRGGAVMTSNEEGSIFLMARDMSSFKTIPAPGGHVSFSAPYKPEGKE